MPAQVSLDSTYGSMLIGAMIAICLFGASIVQLYVYFCRFPDDALYIRVLVSSLMALDSVQAVFMVHLMYTLLVTNWGDVSSLNDVPWSLHAEIISNAVAVFIVQCFFIRRIWILSEYKNKLPCSLSAIALTVLGAAMFIGIKDAGHQSFSGFHDYTAIVTVWSIFDMVLDGAIAGILCYHLQRSRTSIKRSDNIIDTIIVFTINTGAITCSASTAHLVLFLASPDTGVHFAFHFMLAKLYTNSLYASLNSRTSLRRNAENNRSLFGSSSRGTTYAGRAMVEAPVISTYGTSVPRLGAQCPIEAANIAEAQGVLGPPPTARCMEKLGVSTNPRPVYLPNDYRYQPQGT